MTESKTYVLLWRNKYLTADATTLAEMVTATESALGELRAMLTTGKVTLGEAGDDYAHLYTTDAEVADRFGFQDEAEFVGAEVDEFADDHDDDWPGDADGELD